MIREVTIFVIGVLAVSIIAKATAVEKCSSEPPYCEVCKTTWGFLRDVLGNPGLGQSTAAVGKACTCGYIPDKSSALYKQCSDHLDQVPGKLLAFVKATLSDPNAHCGFACGHSAKNASLPACPRTPTKRCNEPDIQLCNVCKASAVWTQELLANKNLIKLTSKYLGVYCDLATTSCLQDTCKTFIGTFEPMFEIASSMFQIHAPQVCTPFCRAPAENETPRIGQHISSLLKDLASFLELQARK